MSYKRCFGNLGEKIAIYYLLDNGYEILGKNFYCRQGEIDIIARKNEVVFIEVKTRSNLNYGNPSDSVNLSKIRHMYKSARYYLYKYNLEDMFIRFDVIEVYIFGKSIKINHIKQIM